MMTKNILVLALFTYTGGYAASFTDQDFDGVPDSLDKCPNTPFLNEVNAQGCTTTVLLLPEDTESESLTLNVGYGYSTNEDLVGRARQYLTNIQLSYYYNDWSYSLRTGYYHHNEGDGILDTTFKVKKRFKLTPKLKLSLGAGVKLPTYDFVGNKTDYTLYSSLSYYQSSSLSFFAGLSHTFVNDKKVVTPLQDTNSFYVGVGKFFTSNFYANISYNYSESKFIDEDAAQSLGSTLYYKINKKWFTTLSYSREFDHDLHDSLSFKIGYKIW